MSENKTFSLSKNLFTIVIILTVGTVIVWSFQVYQILQSTQGAYPREIVVEGKGNAFVVPDMAQINVGLVTEGDTTEVIIAENTAKVNEIITAVKAVGIEEEDIQTTSYYLNPKYEWNPTTQIYDEQGFTLDQSIQVKVKDLEIVGDVIAAATGAGANSVSGVQFTVEDIEDALAEAREEAIENATQKAEQISEQAGLKLGKLLNFYEYTDGYAQPYPYPGMGGAMMESQALDAVAPTIEPGQQEINLTVSLTYRIK